MYAVVSAAIHVEVLRGYLLWSPDFTQLSELSHVLLCQTLHGLALPLAEHMHDLLAVILSPVSVHAENASAQPDSCLYQNSPPHQTMEQ